jgi:hypothetical protein
MDKKLTFMAAYDDLMRNAKVFQVMIEPGNTPLDLPFYFLNELLQIFFYDFLKIQVTNWVRKILINRQ